VIAYSLTSASLIVLTITDPWGFVSWVFGD